MAEPRDPSRPASITATASAGDSTVPSARVREDGSTAAGVPPPPLPEFDLPGYRVIGELGRGGMGRVMRAEDLRLRREVAVKQLASGAAGARARFEREAHITARLQHPAIVPVYEAQVDAGGAPFYAMKLVTGRTLTEVIKATTTLSERLALVRHVLAVADAIAYAHSHHVIHRDLKASNVVVGEFGETIVIDWGLAKDLDAAGDPISTDVAPLPVSGDLTQDGTVMGTPAYMPPEQAEGEAVDERADVYALGVMLYHLIAGEMPYAGASSADVLAAVLAGPPKPLLERVPAVPRDLAAIVAKAMAREPGDRYPTARELAGELSRFQCGHMVGAHEYTTRELVARWVRRHRAAVAVGAVALTAAVMGGSLAVRSVVLAGRRAEQSRQAAVHERDQAERARRDAVMRADEGIINRARDLADDRPGESLRLLATLSPGTPRLSEARMIAADALTHAPGSMQGQMGSVGSSLGVYGDGTVFASALDDLLWARPDGTMGIGPAQAPAVAPDGSACAWLEGEHAMIALADARSPQPAARMPQDLPESDGGHPPVHRRVKVPDGTRALAITPGGGALFALAGDHVVRIEVASGQTRDLGVAPAGVFPPQLGSYSWLITAGSIARGEVFVRRAWRADGRELTGPGVPVAASRDGSRALFIDRRRLLVRDAAGVTVVATTDTALVGGAFDDGGRWLAWTQNRDPRIHLWDVTTKRAIALAGHTETSITRAFSRDGHLLATGGNDGVIKIWDLRALAEPRPSTLEPLSSTLSIDAGDAVVAVGFTDAGQLVALTAQGLVARWDLPPIAWTPRLSVVSDDLGWSGEVTDGVAVVQRAGQERRYRLEGVARNPPDPGDELLAFSRDGGVAAVAGVRELIRWEPAREAEQRFAIDGDLLAVAITPAGDRLVALTADGSLWIADAGGTARRLATSLTGDAPELSPDGAHVALRGEQVQVLRSGDGTVVTLAPGSAATFSPDGREVAITGGEFAARCQLAPPHCEPLKHSFDTLFPTFGPGGELAAVRRDLDVVEWPAGTTGEPPTVIARHRATVNEITYSPDGQSVATCGQGSEVQLLDRASGEYRLLAGVHDHPTEVRFAGDQILVADWFRVYTFDDRLPRDESGLRAAIERR